MEKAIEALRKKGYARAMTKLDRQASQGIVHAYIHLDGKIGVLIEVNCETDFVARNEEFRELAKNLAMQIAAANPRCVASTDVPEAELAKEREIIRAQLKDMNKPPQIIDKIVEGKLKKYYEEVCLLDQPYIKEDKMTIQQLISSYVSKFGENIKVRRFARFELGQS
jgi:elongation factor Ts